LKRDSSNGHFLKPHRRGVWVRAFAGTTPFPKIALADFAGLPCADNFSGPPLGFSMQMH
jgi:hypothetical protein